MQYKHNISGNTFLIVAGLSCPWCEPGVTEVNGNTNATTNRNTKRRPSTTTATATNPSSSFFPSSSTNISSLNTQIKGTPIKVKVAILSVSDLAYQKKKVKNEKQ